MVEMVRPPRLAYTGVVTSDWASSVAQHLLHEAVTLADQNHLQVVELWVSDDSSIHVRHVRAGAKLGLRVEELGVDPMVGTPARSSDLVGDSVYHSLYDTRRSAIGATRWGSSGGVTSRARGGRPGSIARGFARWSGADTQPDRRVRDMSCTAASHVPIPEIEPGVTSAGRGPVA